jgi:hypothetical protein
METYSKKQIDLLNAKYHDFVLNANNLNPNLNYKIYATGDSDSLIRKYIAFPDNKILTDNDYKQYNISSKYKE